MIAALPLESLKTYVSWHVLRAAAPWLSQPFVEANFKMRQALTGQKQIQDRWKRCVDLVDGSLGEASGAALCRGDFRRGGQAAHAEDGGRAREIAGRGHSESFVDVAHDTKKQAKVKLQAIRNKIGYPDEYRDYSSVIDQARRSAGERAAGRRVRIEAADCQDRQAARPQGVGHDSAGGECVLQRVV